MTQRQHDEKTANKAFSLLHVTERALPNVYCEMSAFLLYRPLTWFGQNHCLIKQSVHSDSLDVRHSKTLFRRLPNSWSISPHERESGLWKRKIFGFRRFEIQDIRVKESAICRLREHSVFSAQVCSFTRGEKPSAKTSREKIGLLSQTVFLGGWN